MLVAPSAVRPPKKVLLEKSAVKSLRQYLWATQRGKESVATHDGHKTNSYRAGSTYAKAEPPLAGKQGPQA
jgi:hypothetical protein